MSAQYRPYRDEEDVPPEERAWVDDGPSGRIHIYEKTTQDIHHVVTQRHLLMGGCTIALVAAIIGVCIGYFAHTEHTVCTRGRSVALFSVYDEDPLVKDKILDIISTSKFAQHVELFGGTTLLDNHIAEITRSEWKKADLDEIFVDDFTAPITTQGDKPNTVELIYNGTSSKKFELSLSSKEFVFVGNSINKTVSGRLVYGSKLDPQDVRFLISKNITLDAILLIRYGSAPLRQQIIKAIALGAVGILLYQDPYDYHLHYDPAAFPRTSIPEGDLWTESSLDDLDAKASFKDFAVQTISGNIAESLLTLMNDTRSLVPPRMRGTFNITYNAGPSSFDVKLTTLQKTAPEKLTNVFGVIRGRVEPDRYIIVGAGRDSWSRSNVGGLASLQELARVFGELKEQKWRPRRSIIFCSFAAEHMGSAGLNHFLQNRLNVLRGRAVAYIDVSNPVFGFKSVLGTGSPLMSQALFNATQIVKSPNAGGNSTSLYDEWLQAFGFDKISDSIRDLAKAAKDYGEDDSIPLEFNYMLGSSTTKDNRTLSLFHNYLHSTLIARRPYIRLLDYTDGFSTFLSQAGIPVVQLSYVNSEYYDNRRMDSKPYWFRTQFDSLDKVRAASDIGYKHQIAVTKVVAEVVRDLVDSLFVPFNVMEYAVTLQSYTTTAISHFTNLFPDPKVDFEPLKLHVANFTQAAVNFHQTQSKLDLRDPMAIRMINDQLVFLERTFVYTRTNNNNSKHALLEAPRTYPQLGSVFPSVLDLIMTTLGNTDLLDQDLEMKAIIEELVRVIRDATDLIREVHLF